MTGDEEPFILNGISIADWDKTKIEEAKRLGVEIKRSISADTLSMLELGHKLLLFKEFVGHGNFEALREKNFSLSMRTSQRCQSAAQTFYAHKDKVMHMYLTDLQYLAYDDALTTIRTKLLAQLERGEIPDQLVYHKLIKDVRKDARHEKTTQTSQPIGSPKINSEHVNSEGTEANQSQTATQIEAIFEEVETILNPIIPRDSNKQKKLLHFLQSDEGPDKVINFIIDRLKKLIGDLPAHELEGLDQRNSSQVFEIAQHH